MNVKLLIDAHFLLQSMDEIEPARERWDRLAATREDVGVDGTLSGDVHHAADCAKILSRMAIKFEDGTMKAKNLNPPDDAMCVGFSATLFISVDTGGATDEGKALVEDINNSLKRINNALLEPHQGYVSDMHRIYDDFEALLAVFRRIKAATC